MASADIEKMEAIKVATECQQSYYELLPDWFKYDSINYEYIRHKVGYALFGHSQIENNKNYNSITDYNSQNLDIFNRIICDKRSCKIIDKIYQQIIQYGRNKKDSFIYIGIIYNVIILHQKLQQKLKEINSKPNREINNMYALPIFKIKVDMSNTWYIDNDGRIYKDWNDYLRNNTLPKCTMVLPKNGIYQCNPNYKVTEYFSTVWIVALDSPACIIKNSFLSALDVAANAVSVGTSIGLGVATFMTPVGPALMTAGAIASGISGTWNVVRNSQKLVDLSQHKQSVSPMDKNAFSAWLGMGSTVLTVGASGGTMLLSKAARTVTNGRNINNAVKVACNSVTISSLTVNGVGMLYEGYRIIDKYQQDKKIDITDITIFISHVLFFSNTVINNNLANELMLTWKGTIFEKVRNILRINRLKEEFKKIENLHNPSAQNKSNGIIYQLRKVINTEDFLNGLNITNLHQRIHTKYENGKVILNNMKLLDPMIFIANLSSISSIGFNLMQLVRVEDIQGRNDVLTKLKCVLTGLLKQFYLNKSVTKQSLDVNKYDELLTEMKYVANAKHILIKIFKASEIVISRCNGPEQFLTELVHFLWSYCKMTLKEYIADNNCDYNKNVISDVLSTIVSCVHDHIDTLGDGLFAAFYTYVSNREAAQTTAY